MATIALIKEAIAALKDRTGSSAMAINKYIETEKKVRRSCVFRGAYSPKNVGVFCDEFLTRASERR
jgi:linker histone H1 and H5 family